MESVGVIELFLCFSRYHVQHMVTG